MEEQQKLESLYSATTAVMLERRGVGLFLSARKEIFHNEHPESSESSKEEDPSELEKRT